MANNPYVNKVVYGNSTLIDLSQDTATQADVAQGKYFHLPTGERVQGTATGGGVGGITQDQDGYLVLSPDGDVPTLITKTITQNGTYDAEDDNADGYSSVTVDVSGGGGIAFEPKKDGKTHLYFNIISETSKKVGLKITGDSTETIDWGDGTTSSYSNLSTHTYADVGMYEVTLSSGLKLQPFNGIGTEGYYYGSTLVGVEIATASLGSQMFGEYTPSLLWIYYNDHTMTGNNDTYYTNYHDGERALQYCRLDPYLGYFGSYMFRYCQSLSSIEIPSGITAIPTYCFQYCRGLQSVTIPASVTSIGNSAFQYSIGIKEYHIKPTAPPTLGTNTLYVASGVKIYVPSASLTTYQTASGWSSYASYMVGE